MNRLLQRVETETPEGFDYNWLGAFVRSIDVSELDYQSHLPTIDTPDRYARNILTLAPFEVVLLHWPAGVESAVHLHEGFWGYVLCLEGQIDNVTYIEEGNVIREHVTSRALPGGIVNEPDGTVHKIVNSDPEKPLVTLHFYYPALDTLNNLVLYNLEEGTRGILNELAKTASFAEPDEHFRSLERNAFTFEPLSVRKRSHTIFPIVPKPHPTAIRELVGRYYDEQATQYDSFDLQHESRSKYTARINALIAAHFRQMPRLDNVLDLACGTGRRASEIKVASGRPYDLHGVDISDSMCAMARQRGMYVHVSPWLDAEIPSGLFDAVTFLYAYGHIPSMEERRAALEKVFEVLRPGGKLFIDVFNVQDAHEWGPHAVAYFEEHELQTMGYERGDVFYRKTDGSEVAFLHYCREESMQAMLEDIGFSVHSVQHIGYVHRSGEVLDEHGEGSLFFIIEKPPFNA